MANPLTGAAKKAVDAYIDIKRKLRGPREDDPPDVKAKLTWVAPPPPALQDSPGAQANDTEPLP
jgi:hypothetical protein